MDQQVGRMGVPEEWVDAGHAFHTYTLTSPDGSGERGGAAAVLGVCCTALVWRLHACFAAAAPSHQEGFGMACSNEHSCLLMPLPQPPSLPPPQSPVKPPASRT